MTGNNLCLPDHYQPYTAPLDWPVREAREMSEWGIDPGSGAVIRRFTAGACYHATGEHTVIYRDPDNRNPHAQLDRMDGSRVLFQKDDWTKGSDYPLEVFVHDRTTGRCTQLPFGGRHTANPSGHMSWIGQTDAVACLVEWRRGERLHDPRHPAGNLAIARPGDETPRVIGGAGHAYWQISVSQCGRYFLCNDFIDIEGNYRTGTDVLYDSAQPTHRGSLRLVAGSFATGHTRTLITDAPGSGRGHYFTADNRHVVYAATAWGQWHVFAAAVPEGFLEGLE
jgi:hypothetical protein